MELLDLELKYSELLSFLNEPSSNRKRLLRISEFFDFVLSFSNRNLAEAYIICLFPRYLSLIRSIKIRGLNPFKISSIVDQTQKIKEFTFLNSYDFEIEEVLRILQNKYVLSLNWLSGKGSVDCRNMIYFPVLEKNNSGYDFGFLEIIKVQIIEGENKFILEPIESEDDEQIQDQLRLCWDNAIKYCKKFISKIKPTHTVELKFENRFGIYIGNSFGIAVTLAFIEAILKHYNSKIIVNINGCIAVTGGIDKNSKIISTSKTIIDAKVEAVFYSDAQIFCVPKINEIRAEEKLSDLKLNFPKRNLRIIGLTDLEDLLSRRNIVDIYKRSIIERAILYAYSTWKSMILVIVLTLISIYLFALDFDDNPAMFEQKGKLLTVQNKNGKMLWNINLIFDPIVIGQDLAAGSRKIIDINGDGLNEILICEEDFSYDDNRRGRIVCFDNKKNVVWNYNFKDTVLTFRSWTKNYFVSIIDTLTIQNSKALLLRARNEPNFPNAVFMLDLKTGKRLDSLNTLWNAGGITNSILGDFNEDGKKELVLGGINNGYECAVFFSVNLDRIKGQTPSKDRYVFKDIQKALLNNYILLPHTDYGKLIFRHNVVPYNTLFFDSKSKEFQVSTYEGLDNPILFHYRFDKNFNFLWVDCADNAQQLRDSLVSQGILRPPYTNTNEYFKILKDQIRYWDGEKFNSIEESLK